MRWDPAQYEKFKAQRRQPFDVLASMLTPVPGGAVVDLGCGSGELTRSLHAITQAASTLGLDHSQEMLAGSAQFAGDGVTFSCEDIQSFEPAARFDIIFSNAALQWVPGPHDVLTRLVQGLAPGGQLAIQVPWNDAHPSHAIAAELAAQPRYASALGGWVRQTHALPVTGYASALHALGMQQVHCRVQVFGHELPGRSALLEWVKGSLLRAYKARLPAALFEDFQKDYARLLSEQVPDDTPLYYPFQRILVHALKPAGDRA